MAALPRYSCQRLDGADLHGQHADSSGINIHGEVVGTGQFARQEALLTAAHWNSNGSVDYLVHSHRESGAYGINDAGQIAGYVTLSDGGMHPAVWTDGKASVLPTLAGRQGAGYAASINNRGQLVGASTTYWSGKWRWRATLWDHGRAINLGAIDKHLISRAVAINDGGVVVGFSDLPRNERRAVQWSGDAMTELATLRGGTRAMAAGVNRDGVVVGTSNTADHIAYDHAVAWKDGEVLDLGTLPDDLYSDAAAINASAVIVGHSSDGYGAGTAVVWFGTDAAPVDLNGLIVAGGCRDERGNVRLLSDATGISEQGAIAATSYTAGPKGYVQAMAFKLTPL